uniref:Uncharacterized protein n=1 Tax=Parascaris equorum TaxID=6256 RepID=A0A914SB42_PAREQ
MKLEGSIQRIFHFLLYFFGLLGINKDKCVSVGHNRRGK